MATPMDPGYRYPIGKPGQPWGEEERKQWRESASIKRSYAENVLAKVCGPFKERFEVEQYGSLSYDSDRYPLYAVKSRNWDSARKTVLVTGGVHGYETSGVHGALKFIDTMVQQQ